MSPIRTASLMLVYLSLPPLAVAQAPLVPRKTWFAARDKAAVQMGATGGPVILTPALLALQDTKPLVESADTHYYDFWVGRWVVEKDGRVDPGATTFEVTRGVHAGALEETWSGGATTSARAFRAWDKTGGRWMHVWISGNGLFQVWEGRRVGTDWYMFKEFDINGDRYLSRQAVLSRGEGRAVRISERSDDGGKTWTLRFREDLRRDGGQAP